jgi:hypothetical protein
VLYNSVLMSVETEGPLKQGEIPRELRISQTSPPIGNTAIEGFKGSGTDHSLFSGQYANNARVNGFPTPLERNARTAHFITIDRVGDLQVRRQNQAEILGILDGYLELEKHLKAGGQNPSNRHFGVIIDGENDYSFIDNVTFLGYEYSNKNMETRRVPSHAVFSSELPEGEQLLLDKNLVSVPINKIHHINYAYPESENENDKETAKEEPALA